MADQLHRSSWKVRSDPPNLLVSPVALDARRRTPRPPAVARSDPEASQQTVRRAAPTQAARLRFIVRGQTSGGAWGRRENLVVRIPIVSEFPTASGLSTRRVVFVATAKPSGVNEEEKFRADLGQSAVSVLLAKSPAPQENLHRNRGSRSRGFLLSFPLRDRRHERSQGEFATLRLSASGRPPKYGLPSTVRLNLYLLRTYR